MNHATKPRKYPSRMSYFKCPVCGYAVSISNKWAKAGPPRCLNNEVQDTGEFCSNRTKLLEQIK